MNITEAIKNRRTIRKFEQKPVSKDDLIKLIDLTRYAAYGAVSYTHLDVYKRQLLYNFLKIYQFI